MVVEVVLYICCEVAICLEDVAAFFALRLALFIMLVFIILIFVVNIIVFVGLVLDQFVESFGTTSWMSVSFVAVFLLLVGGCAI